MKLTTPRIFLTMFTLTVAAVLGSLIYLHEREPPPDPDAPPTGPSTVIGGIRKRAAARTAKARETTALEIKHMVAGDAGATSGPASAR